ncbi:glyoxalase/bleomycin resistance/dioxygenase family protein [Microbacterium gorillae]|uniref:glyoxalase/bleomycin resistance/dioxygenase family protein n=1 Tax=Microbacterium gorillae TaxID=1231063 RepID=UPI00058F282C|nr:glyoxalase/bleomycin resistance/dioxygenase family protein [Microbacterium gorillae]
MTLTVQAIRFTTDVPAMRTFLERLGLVAVITASDPETDADTWAVMRSGSGDVLLHALATATSPAVAGQTELSLETDDLDALADRFGLTPIDESYGRMVQLTDPLGDEVWVNGAQTDFYGYATADASPDPAVSVAPVRFTDPSGAYGAFLERLGMTAAEGGDEWFRSFRADRGSVGLHVARPGEFEQFLRGDHGARVHLTLSTTQDLHALADRLRADGIDVRVDESFGTMLELTDPDGCPLQIHPA